MSDILLSPPVPASLGGDDPSARLVPRAASLLRLLAGYHAVLCAVAPDAAGAKIVKDVGAAIGDRACRLGVVSALWFDWPLDASACIFPTPLDRRARLIVRRQEALDNMVRELSLPDAEVFALAGDPAAEIRGLARLWKADVVLFSRTAGTGLRNRRGCRGGFDSVGLDDEGRVASASLAERLLGV